MNPCFWGKSKPPPGVPLDLTHPGAQNLVACWALLEGAGQRTADLGRNARTGTLSGSVWSPGARGAAVRLASTGGSTNNIQIGANTVNKLLTGATGATILSRIFVVGNGQASTFSDSWLSWLINSPNTNGGFCGVDSSGHLWVQCRSASGDSSTTKAGSTVLPLNTWVDVAVAISYAASTVTLYVNGQVDGTQAATFASKTYNPVGSTVADALGDISGAGNSGTLNGSQEYLYLYNAALPAEAIARIQAQPYQIFAAPVWRRRRGAATAYSSSLDGTLTSAGAAVKAAAKPLAGSAASAGALVRACSKVASGSISSAGALVKASAKALAGGCASAGGLVRASGKIAAGSLTSSGGVVKACGKVLAGSCASAGVLGRGRAKALAGAIASASGLVRTSAKEIAGAITPAGTLSKACSKVFAGAIALSASLAYALATKIRLRLSGAISDPKLSGATGSDALTGERTDSPLDGTPS